MSLDAGNIGQREVAIPIAIEGLSNDESVFAPWADWEPSPIGHHGRACCEMAREWIVVSDFSGLKGGGVLTGPRWLRQRFEWGPSRYPIFWCELPEKSKVDCGVLAALSHEVFISRGVRCFRAQLVQEFTPGTAAQWRSGWEGASAITEWIRDTLIYHEGVAVKAASGQVKLWDSSAGWWVDPKSTRGYGATRALRIVAGHETELNWGGHLLSPGVWTTL